MKIELALSSEELSAMELFKNRQGNSYKILSFGSLNTQANNIIFNEMNKDDLRMLSNFLNLRIRKTHN